MKPEYMAAIGACLLLIGSAIWLATRSSEQKQKKTKPAPKTERWSAKVKK